LVALAIASIGQGACRVLLGNSVRARYQASGKEYHAQSVAEGEDSKVDYLVGLFKSTCHFCCLIGLDTGSASGALSIGSAWTELEDERIWKDLRDSGSLPGVFNNATKPTGLCAEGEQVRGKRPFRTLEIKHFLSKNPSFVGLAWCLLAMGGSENLLVQVRLEGSIDTIG